TALQPILPATYNTTTTIDAYAGVAGSASGPYPVVLFSHGFGGERLYYSNLLAGIASWGYVVVSADYLERGLAAQSLGLKTTPTAAFDQSVMFSSLTATEMAADQPGSVLHGTVDPSKVAAVGHSAGGGTAFNALDDPRVATAIGWAPVAPAGAPSKKPVMLIGAEGDTAVLPRTVAHEYAAFPGARSLVEISGEGHNTYTDICVDIRQGGGLVNYAVTNHLISASLAKLAINGCQAKDLPPPRFWPIVQYYTVFQLKSVFSHGPSTVPVPAENTFPGFTVTVTQGS
ncbi:MAG: alpha/beta hydrolase family protein, partial [Acidimicrobiales bacterium]